MAFNFEYPYVDSQKFNDDWLLMTMKKLLKEFNDFVNLNKIKYANPISWDITSQYEINTIVIDPQTGDAYISVAAVPYGVSLSNTKYWVIIFNYANTISKLQQQIAAADEGLSTTATAPRSAGDLVWLNGYLYKVTAPMIAGDSYVVNSNCKKTTIEEEMQLIVDSIEEVTEDYNSKIGTLSDLHTTDKTNVVAAINELVTTIASISESITAAVNSLREDIIEVINVKERGLDPTYTDDNSTALAAIIASASAGSTLYFPKGKYLFSSKITLAKQLNIVGDGIESILVFNGDGIEVISDRCNIKDLLLLPLSTNSTGLYCEGDFCRIENIFLRDNGSDGSVYWKNSIHLYDPWYTLVSNVQINDYKASSYRRGVGIRCSACVNVLLENIYVGFKQFGIVCDNTEVQSHNCDGIQIEQGNIVVCDQGINIAAGSNYFFNNLLMDQIYNYCYNLSNCGYLYVNDSYIAILSASTPSADSRIVYASNCNHVEFNSCSFRGNSVLTVGLAFYTCDDINISNGDIFYLTDAIVFYTEETGKRLKIVNNTFNTVTGNTLNASKCDLVVSNNVNMTNILTGSNVLPINKTAVITHTETIADVENSYYYFNVPLDCGWTPKYAVVQVPAINAMLVTQVRSLNASRVQIQLYGDSAIGTLGDVTFKILLFA